MGNNLKSTYRSLLGQTGKITTNSFLAHLTLHDGVSVSVPIINVYMDEDVVAMLLPSPEEIRSGGKR